MKKATKRCSGGPTIALSFAKTSQIVERLPSVSLTVDFEPRLKTRG